MLEESKPPAKSEALSAGAELETLLARNRNQPARTIPQATHYVVVADEIGAAVGHPSRSKGDVVEAGQFGDQIARLIGCNAIRPATPDEACQTHCHVADGSAVASSYEAQIAEGRRQLAAAHAANAEKTAEMAQLRGLVAQPNDAERKGVQEAMNKKDKVIDQLQKENAQLRDQLGKKAKSEGK